MARWRLIFHCGGCGAGVERSLYTPHSQIIRGEESGYVEVCPDCGHMQGRVVKTARKESTAVWYKPWTWARSHWVGIKEFKAD